MEARAASITFAAVLGTGFATLAFAVTGVSALGDDLQAAAPRTAPAPAVLSPSEERGDTAPRSTPSPSAAEALQLEDVCDRTKREGREGADAPASTPSAETAKEY